MGQLRDLQAVVFLNKAVPNGTFEYGPAINARAWNSNSGADTLESDRVCLAGDVNDLGTATLITFVVEEAPTASGPWSPVGLFDAPTVASGVSTSALTSVRFTRASTGAIPSVSFEPNQAFFRVGVQGNNTGAVVDMDAYLSQKGA